MLRFFASMAPHLERFAAHEIRLHGGVVLETQKTRVEFTVPSLSVLYRVCLWSRVLFRVYRPVAVFPCADEEQLYQGVLGRVRWAEHFAPGTPFAVDATGVLGHDSLTNPHFVALRVKDAIVDQQRRDGFERSPVDIRGASARVNVFVNENKCRISVDMSGADSLHRRGYREPSSNGNGAAAAAAAAGDDSAPLKESTAAGLLVYSGWPTYMDEMALLDPLCGSGTIPVEAASVLLDRAPGLGRRTSTYGFMHQGDYDGKAWRGLLAEAEERFSAAKAAQKGRPVRVFGSDISPEAIRRAKKGADVAGLADYIEFKLCDVAAVQRPPAFDRGVVVTNPPYGLRLMSNHQSGRPINSSNVELTDLYRSLGQRLKTGFEGWNAWILSGNDRLEKTFKQHSVGLGEPQKSHKITNGGLDCRVVKYKLRSAEDGSQ